MAEFSRGEDWIYTIQNDQGNYFYAGKADGDRQVILFTSGIALFFDAEGNLIGREDRQPPMPEPYRLDRQEDGLHLDTRRNVLEQIFDYWSTDVGRRALEHDERDRERIFRAFFQPWMDEIGFRPGTIHVKRFSLKSGDISISDLPGHFEEFLEDPHDSSFCDEDREEYPRMIDEWCRGGNYVLWYGNDLWMTGDGEIEST